MSNLQTSRPNVAGLSRLGLGEALRRLKGSVGRICRGTLFADSSVLMNG